MAQGRCDRVVVGDPADLFLFHRTLQHVGRQIQIDRARPSGACLPEAHGHVFWQAGGTIHLHGHFGDALEHRDVFRLLEGTRATPLLGTRASEDEQGPTVVVRDVGPGHTIGDPRPGGQHGDSYLVFDIPIGGSGKRCRLLVADPNRTHATVRRPSHDVLYRPPSQTKEDLDALTLQCLRYQCAPLDASHATPPLVRCRPLRPSPAPVAWPAHTPPAHAGWPL